MTLRPGSSAPRAATIYDVAARARVSHQSVSRLLKGEKVSEETRTRVEAALVELEYRPNIAARSLATLRSNRIGALTYDMSLVGPLQLMTSAGAAARKAGYVLDVVSLDPADDASIREAISLLNQQDVAGILAFAPTDSMLRMLHAATFRVPVHVEPEVDPAGSFFRPDVGVIAADLAIRHLLNLGHRRIAHISGPLDWPSARSRASAYTRALRAVGEEPLELFEGDWTAASGYERTQQILASFPGLTAIFAANDQMALGALHALAESGLPVPEAVSVVGMDDAPESRYYNPSLSTIPLNFEGHGQYAFDRLLSLIEGRERVIMPEHVQTAFIHRDSSGPASDR